MGKVVMKRGMCADILIDTAVHTQGGGLCRRIIYQNM